MATKKKIPDQKDIAIYKSIHTAALGIEDTAEKLEALENVRASMEDQKKAATDRKHNIRESWTATGGAISFFLFMTVGAGVAESSDTKDDLALLAVPVPVVLTTLMGRLLSRRAKAAENGTGDIADDAERNIGQIIADNKTFVLTAQNLPFFMHDREDVKKIFKEASDARTAQEPAAASAADSKNTLKL